ncbi:MAG: hypothetical protein OHK0015_54700 [Chloroflexi bacterium OHK40]
MGSGEPIIVPPALTAWLVCASQRWAEGARFSTTDPRKGGLRIPEATHGVSLWVARSRGFSLAGSLRGRRKWWRYKALRSQGQGIGDACREEWRAEEQSGEEERVEKAVDLTMAVR